MCRIHCCWCFRSNCIHHSPCGDCRSGQVTNDDMMLFNNAKLAYHRQNGCLRLVMLCAPCWPCVIGASCLSLCCESASLALYDTSKLDQSMRFNETVCFNMVIHFSMDLDPNYKFPVNGSSSQNHTWDVADAPASSPASAPAAAAPVINIINTNENKIGDISTNVSQNQAPAGNYGGPANAFSTLSAKDKIKQGRIDKLIREERFSEAEKLANDL